MVRLTHVHSFVLFHSPLHPRPTQYLIANLDMSYNFGNIDLAHLPFPVHLRIDYIRVYQPQNARNVGCDPPNFPTAKYIERYMDAYTDANYTTWSGDYGRKWPGNGWLGECAGQGGVGAGTTGGGGGATPPMTAPAR